MKDYLKTISNIINKKPKIKYFKIQKGDVKKTHGSQKLLKKKIKNIQYTSLDQGLKKYYEWFKKYYS